MAAGGDEDGRGPPPPSSWIHEHFPVLHPSLRPERVEILRSGLAEEIVQCSCVRLGSVSSALMEALLWRQALPAPFFLLLVLPSHPSSVHTIIVHQIEMR